MRVARDLVHPGCKGSIRLIAFPVFQHPEENVLHQIFAQVAVSVHMHKVVEQRAMMPLKQDRQAPQVAIPDGLHQAAVACFVHNWNTGSVKRLRRVLQFFGSSVPEPKNR